MLRFLPLILLIFLTSPSFAGTMTLKSNESWSGKVSPKGSVIVPADVTLTIQPGTDITFPEGASLNVQGRLLAKGSTKDPIVFHAGSDKRGAWQGIMFEQGPKEGSELLHVRIEGTTQCVTLTGAKVRIADSILRNSNKGVLSGVGAYILIERTTISDMSESGVEASVGSQGKILNCQIRRTSNFGIQIDKKSALVVRDNQISHSKVGLFVSGDSPPIEGNSIDHCDAGIVLLQASPSTTVGGNKIADCKSGIASHQFSAPLLIKNSIQRCEVGIDCFQASSPTIQQNFFSKNQRAISCIQLCNPAISRNDLNDNQTAIYLHLSSYPQIHDNNFDGNHYHIELDNMSSDWEARAKKKPVRSREKQSEILSMQDRANPMDYQVDSGKEGYVNAKSNFWGKVTTTEMGSKGENGNITTIQDAFDVPTRTYEGWPGEYKQDRVRYDGWSKKKLAGTYTP